MPNYKITEIEGIGAANADKLVAAGVRTVMMLLKKGCTPEGRELLAEKSGISESKLLSWVNMADLIRIRGIGGEYAELLHEAGVDTIKELRNRNPENLHSKIIGINNSYRRVRQLPTLKQIQSWVLLAKTTEPMVTY